jgi:hypothetical protein
MFILKIKNELNMRFVYCSLIEKNVLTKRIVLLTFSTVSTVSFCSNRSFSYISICYSYDNEMSFKNGETTKNEEYPKTTKIVLINNMTQNSALIASTKDNALRLLAFVSALLLLICVFSFASDDIGNVSEDFKERTSLTNMRAVIENVPKEDDQRKKMYCAKVANVGDWQFGADVRCDDDRDDLIVYASFGCPSKKKKTRPELTFFATYLKRKNEVDRKKRKQWIPNEELAKTCGYFKFASATTQEEERSSDGDNSEAVEGVDLDRTVASSESSSSGGSGSSSTDGDDDDDENAKNNFAIQRMMRGRDALFVGDSQVRHVYAAFLRIAAIGDAHEAHLHPPKRPKLKTSFNRKYGFYGRNRLHHEDNIEEEAVGDVPGDKHSKTDPLKHRNWTFAIQGGGAASFVWAPQASDVVEVIKERLVLNADGESTKESQFSSPDFVVAGVGLWHMLHESDANDFQRQLAEVKNLLDDINFKQTVPFWLTVSKPGPSHLMNSVKKQTRLTRDSWALYREATEKEFDDNSQTLAIDFGAMTEKCGSKCSVDGVHLDETTYDAAAQVLLNSLASVWDVKLKNSGNSKGKEEDFEPLDFSEPGGASMNAADDEE